MSKGVIFSDEDVAEALIEEGFDVKKAAAAVGMTERNMFYRIANNPQLKKLQKEESTLLTIKATQVLNNHLDKGNDRVAMFILRTQGKDLGWNEKVEVEQHVTYDLPIDGIEKLIADKVDKIEKKPKPKAEKKPKTKPKTKKKTN